MNRKIITAAWILGCSLAFSQLAGCSQDGNSALSKYQDSAVQNENSVPQYSNPITLNEADPWVYYHPLDGYYYYTATDRRFDRITIKKAKTINGLKYNCEDEYEVIRENKGCLAGLVYDYIWAPELHYCDGKWYMFFTGSDNASNVWAVRSQVAVCTDKDPVRGSWTYLGQIKGYTKEKPEENIMTVFNLDGTAFCVDGQWYYAWAQYLYDGGWADENTVSDQITVKGKTYINGAPNNGWSSILIGKTSSRDFTTVTDVTVLSVPEYTWEYGKDTSICTHTDANVNVCEGPAILQRNGKIFIAYSASSCDEAYCLGLLSCSDSADLTDSSNWTKSDKPVFTTSVKNGIYGPGHCSFTKDGDYDVIVYHARNYAGLYNSENAKITSGLNDPHRSARAKVFTWNDDGTPDFGEAE